MKKKLLAAWVLAAVIGVAHARGTVMVQPDRVDLGAGAATLTSERVRQAIDRAAARYEWTVVTEQPGVVQLKHNKQNKHEATVEVAYDAGGFQIRYVGSINLNYSSKNGVAQIHSVYNTWIGNLGRAIVTEAMVQPVAGQ